MLKRPDSLSRWITLAGTHQGHLPTQSSVRLACTCIGVCDPALISPLKPERPWGDQSGHLGDPGGRPRGQSSLRARLHCPTGPGPLQGPWEHGPHWGAFRGRQCLPSNGTAGGGRDVWEPPPTRLSCRPASIHRPTISKPPPGDSESCRRAGSRADATGGRGHRAVPWQGWRGQRERPHVGPQPRPTSNLLQV